VCPARPGWSGGAAGQHRQWIAVDACDDGAAQVRHCVMVAALQLLRVDAPPRAMPPLENRHLVARSPQLSRCRQSCGASRHHVLCCAGGGGQAGPKRGREQLVRFSL
jgi:hypothetical protein